jgi:hypothetical protein
LQASSATIEEVIMIAAGEVALGGHRAGGTFMCRCPNHPDRTPSLVVRDTISGVLVHCHAECPQSLVIEALRVRGVWARRERRLDPRPTSAPPARRYANRTVVAGRAVQNRRRRRRAAGCDLADRPRRERLQDRQKDARAGVGPRSRSMLMRTSSLGSA